MRTGAGPGSGSRAPGPPADASRAQTQLGQVPEAVLEHARCLTATCPPDAVLHLAAAAPACEPKCGQAGTTRCALSRATSVIVTPQLALPRRRPGRAHGARRRPNFTLPARLRATPTPFESKRLDRQPFAIDDLSHDADYPGRGADRAQSPHDHSPPTPDIDRRPPDSARWCLLLAAGERSRAQFLNILGASRCRASDNKLMWAAVNKVLAGPPTAWRSPGRTTPGVGVRAVTTCSSRTADLHTSDRRMETAPVPPTWDDGSHDRPRPPRARRRTSSATLGVIFIGALIVACLWVCGRSSRQPSGRRCSSCPPGRCCSGSRPGSPTGAASPWQ